MRVSGREVTWARRPARLALKARPWGARRWGAGRLALGRLAAVLSACTLAPALAGCGFTPLYATPGLTPALSSVDIVTPTSREGYLVRRQLGEQLARDADTPALYRLTCTLSEVRQPRGVRVNNVASRYEVGLAVNYVLSDSATGKVLLVGSAPVEVSYDSADPPYAGVQANQDGEVRAADQAAIRIRLDLSRYFNQQAHPAAPGAPAITIDPRTSQPVRPEVIQRPAITGPAPLIGGAAGDTP